MSHDVVVAIGPADIRPSMALNLCEGLDILNRRKCGTPVFLGLRTDKRAEDIVRERETPRGK